ncbi:hypothetical protein [Streptomyces sp. GC420]|uniref:hypothetical protein n=1 Tax=Streptomyces sp. GC420 TaxID=2697568 RepID=UPI001414F2D2|nr:hypothetical protein [Streptomyces sp. GC420]NBM16177.1 hypothetical protein [Streptomyces sp. GC420]
MVSVNSECVRHAFVEQVPGGTRLGPARQLAMSWTGRSDLMPLTRKSARPSHPHAERPS